MTALVGALRPPSPAPPPRRIKVVAAPVPALPPIWADRTADWLIGPEAFRAQIPGATGRIANRLAPGRGVLIACNAAATVPATALAAWAPDLSGSLRMAGLLTRRNDGKLLLTLTFQATEGAAYATGAGVSAGLALGSHNLGFKLGAERSAGAELSEVAVATLRFDPTDPADVKRLRDLLEPHLTGGGPDGGTALGRALAHNRTSISVGGGLGASAGWTAGLTAGDQDADGSGVAADSTWKIKAKLGLTGSANGEIYRTWERDGSVTDMVGLELGAEGSLKLPMQAGAKLSDRVAAAFNATHGADGKLSDLSVVYTQALTARATLAILPLDPGAKAGAKLVVTRALNAAGLEAARALIAAGATPFAAFHRVSADPALVDEKRVTVTNRAWLFGFDFQAALAGLAVRLTGALSAGTITRHAAGNEDPGLRELLMMMKGTTSRW
ncbi:MAG: hypothetical protein JWM80_382 [Cyanobacteria bacterium RYN_339]|nr:hypothetical protein [Cyanobacteria bacterium RYN_339]